MLNAFEQLPSVYGELDRPPTGQGVISGLVQGILQGQDRQPRSGECSDLAVHNPGLVQPRASGVQLLVSCAGNSL
jgi:hypothetical protein